MKRCFLATVFLLSTAMIDANAAAQDVTETQPLESSDLFGPPTAQTPSQFNTEAKDLNFSVSIGAWNPSKFLSQMRTALAKADTAEKKKALMDRLQQLLGEYFEADMRERVKELDAIKARVKQMEELLDKRVEAKEKIVELRILTLVNEANGLGWSGPPKNARPMQNQNNNPFANPGNLFRGNLPTAGEGPFGGDPNLDPFN